MKYVQRVNSTNQSGTVFRLYQTAQGAARRAQGRVQVLLRSKASAQALTRAQLAEDSAQLKASDLANRYRTTTADTTNTSKLALIAPAAHASSDRRTMLERLVAIGVIGGLILGLGLALLRTNWRVLRAPRPE